MQLPDVTLGTPRVRLAGVVTVAVVMCAPLTASAAPGHEAAVARKAPAPGVSFGGTTSQDFPVVIETTKNGRKVARAVIAIRLTCSAGGIIAMPDGFQRLTITKTGKFGAEFGPQTVRNDDGTTSDLEGALRGRFNSSRTRVSGTWSFKGTDHDAAGAITDTCDSGEVSWSAKQ